MAPSRVRNDALHSSCQKFPAELFWNFCQLRCTSSCTLFSYAAAHSQGEAADDFPVSQNTTGNILPCCATESTKIRRAEKKENLNVTLESRESQAASGSCFALIGLFFQPDPSCPPSKKGLCLTPTTKWKKS